MKDIKSKNRDHMLQRVELYISCKGLPKMDVMSNTDTYVVLSTRNAQNESWQHVGQTEIIFDNQNPKFAHSFILDFFFEKKQFFKIEVRDSEDNTGRKFEPIGEAEFMLGKLIGSRAKQLSLPVKKGAKDKGEILIQCEKRGQENKLVKFHLDGVGVTGFGWWNGISPLITIQKPLLSDALYEEMIAGKLEPNSIADDDWAKIYETGHLKKGGNCDFGNIEITASKLYGTSKNSFLKVTLYNWKSNGNHKYKGHIIIKAADLKNGARFILNHVTKGKSPGSLCVNSYLESVFFAFTDFLHAGLNLSLSVNIDFTQSNGAYSDPNSLHAYLPNAHNQYQQSILSVVDILQNYDYNGMIHAIGFGGQPNYAGFPGAGHPNHFFPLSGNPVQSVGHGVQGVFELYEYAKQHVALSGPTFFGPLLAGNIQMVRSQMLQNPSTYSVILILTDGIIHDMDETIKLLIEATSLPLSVIIIGVGNEDFSDMEALDGDRGRLTYGSQVAKRDIVQFVPFRNFKDYNSLAESVLRELPGQVVQYFNLIGRIPEAISNPY